MLDVFEFDASETRTLYEVPDDWPDGILHVQLPAEAEVLEVNVVPKEEPPSDDNSIFTFVIPEDDQVIL